MSRNSTKKKGKKNGKQAGGRAERLLLIAIMAIGVLGLAVSYAGPSKRGNSPSASSIDSTSSDGKLKSDRMILHLNQRGDTTKKPAEKSRF